MGAYEWNTFVGTFENKETEQFNSFYIYPNPAHNKIHISYERNNKIDRICIYNQLGIKVLELENIVDEFDISNLVNGVYILEVNIKNDAKFSKFIKN